MENFSKEDVAILRNHVTNIDNNIYVIYNLPPEVIAVLFAYVSRSPNTFRENLLSLIKQKDLNVGSLINCYNSIDFSSAKEKAKQFHERWVVGYGHSSVAEHAVASVAIEDVSILASKAIEDNRLASYTEKSTRYQLFDKTRYIRPKKIMDSKFKELYIETMNHLFDEYQAFYEKMLEHVKSKFPKKPEQTDKLYETISKARAFDIARYVLPAGTLTNLAMTANARVYEHAITKLMSCGLDEYSEIGIKMKTEIQKLIPTLIKYADKNEYMFSTNKGMEEFCDDIIMPEHDNTPVKIVSYDKEAYAKIAAAIIYKYMQKPLDKCLDFTKSLTEAELDEIFSKYLGKMGKHDYPMREIEHVYYTFDVLVDYGAFRDIQRHRMCTQTTQDLTTEHGFSMPDEYNEVGLSAKYEKCMEKAAIANKFISVEFQKEAQYVIPLAYKKRVLFTWNLRELYHFIKLRSGKEGHISYRKIAWLCYGELAKVHPLLAKYLRVDKSEGPSR
ncbi:MAG: FAD-dependent thymidylate synthase [archaeon]